MDRFGRVQAVELIDLGKSNSSGSWCSSIVGIAVTTGSQIVFTVSGIST